MEQPNFKNVDELKEWIINVHEKEIIEMKKAQELPAAFWESYSAFCNTSGGWILLGVIEGKPTNKIQGVGNISKTQISLWDMLSNPNKVNYRSVDNEDVQVVNIDGAEVMIVCVKEAPESMKPVYFNGKRENTFIRTGDGDRRATKLELEAFERNAMPCHDSLPVEYTDIEKTDLRIWNIDFADSYPDLEDEAKAILRVILKCNVPMSVSKMREKTGLSDYKVRKWLETLDEKK